MKVVDASVKRKSAKGVLKMKLAAEKLCAYSRQLFQHMELAKKFSHSLMT